MSANTFKDTIVPVRYKLSALWTSVMFCYIYADYFELYVPEKVESLISGENVLNSPLALFLASVILAIPATLIGFNVLIGPKILRILNIIFGLFFTIMMLFIAINSLTPWYGFYAFFGFLESGITSTIVLLAWRWPKE